MLNDINLKEAPAEAGAYLFISNDEVIYVGSSKNLYQRMTEHNTYIKKGSNHGGKKDFYQFLRSNQFKVEFQLADNYRQLEQQLIEKYNPKYNSHRANTGVAWNGNKAEWQKEYRKKYNYEAEKKYYESHKEEIKQYQKQYNKQYQSQLCLYNGETLTLGALKSRFLRRGIPHPTLEAKKYLIN